MQCQASKKDGSRCRAAAVNSYDRCAGHLGLGLAADPKGAATRSAATRQTQAEARKRRPQDVYAEALLKNAEEFAARLVQIALDGDDIAALRAIETLNSRVLGRPKETVEQHVVPDDFRKVDEMTTEEREELYQRLMAAEGLDAEPMS